MKIAEYIMKGWMKTRDFLRTVVKVSLEYEPTLILFIMVQFAIISYQSALFQMLKEYLDQQLESRHQEELQLNKLINKK